MSGTHSGAVKSTEKIKRVHGEDFFKRIGAIGGRNGNTGGFASDPALARKVGATGGQRSKRGHKYLYTSRGYNYYTNKKTGEEVKFKV